MAVIVNGDGILTGVSSLTTALNDITSGRGTITGVTTVGTLQLGAGVSISSPRTQNVSIFTNDSEKLTVDDAGRVGIGTDNPDTLLHVRSSSTTAKLITLEGGNSPRNNYIGLNAADNLEIGADEDNEGSSSSIRFRIDGSEVVRFHNAGRIGVNTDSPQAELHLVADNPNIEFNDTSTSNNAEITLDNAALRIEVDEDNSTASSKIEFRVDGSNKFNIDSSGNFNIAGSIGRFDSTGLIKTANGSATAPSHAFINDPDNGMYRVTTNTIALATNGTERLRINADGNVSIKDEPRLFDGGNTPTLQVADNVSGRWGRVSSAAYTNDTVAGAIVLAKSRNTTIGGHTLVNENDQIGCIFFEGSDGDTFERGAVIQAFVDGTPGDNDMPGRLVFGTSDPGTTGTQERLRINKNGKVNIGGDYSQTTRQLSVVSSAEQVATFEYSGGDTDGSEVRFYHNSASPADNDTLAQLQFSGKNSADEVTLYSSISAQSVDVTNGTEDGNIIFSTRAAGSFGERVRILHTGGISFNGDTNDSNALDDYEEGNLTWVLAKSTHPTTGSTNGSVVKYVKVGRLVHISGRIRTDGTNSDGSGFIVFQSSSTLPFTPETSGTSVVGHFRSQEQYDSSLTASISWVAGSTTLYLYTLDSKGDYSADQNNVPVSVQTNLVMTFSLTYRTNA